jgi:hypothetical protein
MARNTRSKRRKQVALRNPYAVSLKSRAFGQRIVKDKRHKLIEKAEKQDQKGVVLC